jgi:GT2 family glycosyltransferase
MSPRITVVIPNWNGERFLRTCLPSLREQSFRDFETVVVDNGSTDGSVTFISERFPEVRMVRLPENLGFSAAVNAGIRASETEFVALLNNDTEQDPGWLAALVRAAERYPKSGLFASKLLDFDDRGVLDGAGDALRLSGLPYRLGHGERDGGQFDAPGYVFGACAAAAMYRTEMLDRVGLFDEDFVSYCEDGDLSFRAQLAGYRCRYVPDAVVYHMGSASSGGKRSALATRLGSRNSLSLLAKNLPLSLVPHLLPFFLPGQLARLLTAAATGTLRAHLEGLTEAWRQRRLTLEKRRRIQGRREVPNAYVRRLLRASSLAASRSILRRVRGRVQSRLGGKP